MSPFRFIHCSDLHIDTPFTGLSSLQPERAQKLRDATFHAFQNVVRLAIEKKVDAVVIAGDVYDSEDKSLQAQFRFRDGLKQLSDAGIPAFVAHGNHDPLNSRSASLEWPESVRFFPGDRVESFPIERDGQVLAHIYGISFPRSDVQENLALRFERNPQEGFAVGVLHANVGGDRNHDNYAPCTVDDLVPREMDYWALGHIHLRNVLRDRDPAIVYSGNTQARSMKEAGAKGCCLVTLNKNTGPDIQFMPTDVVRFFDDALDISEAEGVDDAVRRIQSHCEHLSAKADGREAVVRLTLTGRTSVHEELQNSVDREAFRVKVRNGLEGREPSIWCELKWETEGTYDVDLLRRREDFISDFIQVCDEAEDGAHRDVLVEALKPLFQDWQGKKQLEGFSDDELKILVRKARTLVLDRLVEKET